MGLLRRLFGKAASEGSSDPPEINLEDLRTATCALFLEIATVDGEFSEAERDRILSILKRDYRLSDKEASELLQATQQELERSIDMWQFTRRINQRCSDREKGDIIEMLWQIIYADGTLQKHEHYLVRKLATLLRLSHEELIDAKLRVIRGGNPSGAP